jgi:hypothetical protein
MKSGNLNFLEPSGSLQACNGTDLLSVFLGCLETMNGRHLTGFLLFTVQTLHAALNDIWLSTNEGGIRDKVDPVHDRRAYTESGGIFPLILKLGTGW